MRIPDAVDSQIERVLLRVLAVDGFVIAGGRAVIVHGFVDRPTEGLDLFSNRYADNVLPTARVRAIAALESEGFTVVVEQRVSNDAFARLIVTDSMGLQRRVELAYDWRSAPAVESDTGPVLNVVDVAATKVLALWSRFEARDVIDVHGLLLRSGLSRTQLLELAHQHDEGFDMASFGQRLLRIDEHEDVEFTRYEVSPKGIASIRSLFRGWAQELTSH